MSREWKPGDVAMVAGTADSAGVPALWQGNQWATSTGRYLNHWQVTARPLVVIDPEDREAVERFSAAYLDVAARMDKSHDRSWYDDEAAADQAQAALREFANPTPPKPAWRDGDVVQSVTTDLVWTRIDGRWVPANDAPGRVDDGKVHQWVRASTNQRCRVLRQQSTEDGAS